VPVEAKLDDVTFVIYEPNASAPDAQINASGHIEETGKIRITLSTPKLLAGSTVQLVYQNRHHETFRSEVIKVSEKPPTAGANCGATRVFAGRRSSARDCSSSRQGQNTIQITLKNKKGIVRDHVSSVVEANGNFTAAFSNGIKLACGDTISLKYYVLAEENYVLNCPDPGAPTPTVPREAIYPSRGRRVMRRRCPSMFLAVRISSKQPVARPTIEVSSRFRSRASWLRDKR
jgi:hypothetical protein